MMKRLGATLLGLWLILTGLLALDLITLTGIVAEIVTKGMPILAIVAGVILLIGK